MAAPANIDPSAINQELLKKIAEPGTHQVGKLTVKTCEQIVKRDGSKANMYEIYFVELGNLRVVIPPIQGSKVKAGDCEDTTIETKPKEGNYTGNDYKVTKFGATTRGSNGSAPAREPTSAEIHGANIAKLTTAALALALEHSPEGETLEAIHALADKHLNWLNKRYEGGIAHLSKPGGAK